MAYTKRRKVTLPINHHDHDADWLEYQLLQLAERDRITACTGYNLAYSSVMSSEPIEHKRENLARYTANCKMRIYVSSKKEQLKPYRESAVKVNRQSNFSIDDL